MNGEIRGWILENIRINFNKIGFRTKLVETSNINLKEEDLGFFGRLEGKKVEKVRFLDKLETELCCETYLFPIKIDFEDGREIEVLVGGICEIEEDMKYPLPIEHTEIDPKPGHVYETPWFLRWLLNRNEPKEEKEE